MIQYKALIRKCGSVRLGMLLLYSVEYEWDKVKKPTFLHQLWMLLLTISSPYFPQVFTAVAVVAAPTLLFIFLRVFRRFIPTHS